MLKISVFLSGSAVPALTLLAHRDEIPVQTAGFHQFSVGAGLDDPAVRDHQDLVGVPDGVQPVGNDKQSLALAQFADGLLNVALVVGVHAGGKDKPVSELSGGQKQRVWIAMALAQDTKVLFLDEPTTYLDIRYQLQILKLIRQLNREFGITIVMVLHDINQSLYYSDEIVAMKDGKMIAHGLPEEILTGGLVREVYDVELDIRTVDGKPFVIPV